MPRPDEQDVPGPVGAEDAADSGDEFIDAVSDPRVSELSEVGEILADLRVGQLKIQVV